MIKHVVMWKLKESALGASKNENALRMKRELESLSTVIPSIQAIEVGVNVTPSSAAFDVVLIATFEDEKGLNEYLSHPRHEEVGAFVAEVRLERIVVDYICAEGS